MKRKLYLIFLSALFLHLSLNAQDASKILKKVEKKYESINDLTASFTQNVIFGVSRMEQNFEGTLKMKKGNKYRIELEQQTIVTDGKTVWSYYHLNKQVMINNYKEDPKSFSPDRVLVNVPKNYNTILLGEEILFGKKNAIIKLTPKDEKSLTKTMKVWIDLNTYLMRQIEITDVSDNFNKYVVNTIKINTNLSDSEFKFDTPKNVETIDFR